MKSLIVLFSIIASSQVWAQSAPEYVELICSNQEKLASVYSSDPIEDVMASKMRELNFWSSRVDDTLKTVQLLNEGGPALVQTPENIKTTTAVLKACAAYFIIEPDVKQYLLSHQCVDDKGQFYDIEEVGFVCRLLMPNK